MPIVRLRRLNCIDLRFAIERPPTAITRISIANRQSQIGNSVNLIYFAIPTLLGEASRLIVLAGALWGIGDLAVLMVDVGHDVRAVRVYMSRLTHVPGGDRDRGAPDRNAPSNISRSA